MIDSFPKLYVGTGMHEGMFSLLKYTLFWIILLISKFTFSYYVEILPLVAPTKAIMNMSVGKYEWHEFFPNGFYILSSSMESNWCTSTWKASKVHAITRNRIRRHRLINPSTTTATSSSTNWQPKKLVADGSEKYKKDMVADESGTCILQLVYVSCAGDFQLSEIELLKDLCSLNVKKKGILWMLMNLTIHRS